GRARPSCPQGPGGASKPACASPARAAQAPCRGRMEGHLESRPRNRRLATSCPFGHTVFTKASDCLNSAPIPSQSDRLHHGGIVSMQVLITRPREDAERLLAETKARGVDALVEPLMTIVPRRGVVLDL